MLIGAIIEHGNIRSGSLSSNILYQDLPSLRSLLYIPEQVDELLRGFLGDTTSSLTRLVLHNTSIKTDDLSFPTLTHFDFDGVSAHNDSGCLLRLIQKSPILERLYLTRIALQEDAIHSSMRLQHLKIVQVEDVLSSVSIAMRILPIPQLRYVLSIMPPADPEVDDQPDMISMRTQVLQTAVRLQQLVNGSTSSTAFYLHSGLYPDVSGRADSQHRLGLQRLDDQSQRFAYTDSCLYIDDFSGVWELVRILHTYGDINLFYWIAKDPLARTLPSIEHLVVEKGEMDFWEDLKAWLSSRSALRNPLKSIDFRQCAEYVTKYGSIANLKKEIIDQGLVGDVLEDGHSI
jgi:hypothetical protein